MRDDGLRKGNSVVSYRLSAVSQSPRDGQRCDGGGFGAKDGFAEGGGNPVRAREELQLVFGPAAFGADGESERLCG